MARASELLSVARKEVGIKESPFGSNCVKYNTWYYGRKVKDTASNKYPWCMVFCQWCAAQVHLSVMRTAGCTVLRDWAMQRGEWVTSDYLPGDWVMFDFDGKMNGETEHVGFLEEVKGSILVTIEGNTGSGNDANGGQVQRRNRDISCVTGAWRPPYDPEGDDEMTYEQWKSYMDRWLMEKAQLPPADSTSPERRWAEENGLITGYADGTKRYKAYCTREQVVLLFARFYLRFIKPHLK